MNTLSRLDSYLASLGERLPQPPPSSSIPPPAQYAPPSVPTGVDVASAASSFTSSFTPPTARRLSDLPPRRRKRRRRPTGTSIKLPPPTTPLVIRFVLALWSILLSFWRSLVGDTRAVRERRRGSRLNALPAAPVSTCTSDNTGLATIPSIRIGDAASSDEASASEAEPSDREWVDPVTRAPENAQVDEPSDNEFRPRTPSSDPTFSFRLRSAQSKDTVSISGSMDVASAGSSSSLQPTPFAPLARSTTPPSILQGPVLNQTRSARLLPNPMQTSLLDPSVPAVPHRVVTPSIMSPPRPHQTPFHLQKTLILDLDETLIHSTSRPMGSAHAGGGMLGLGPGLFGGGRRRRGEGHTIEVVLNGRSTAYHVYKRPYVDFFLKKVASWYTLVIYTASMPEYADPVIDWLDNGRGLFAKRLYRESCYLQPNGSYIKDLGIIEPDLGKVCFMDNSPISYSWNKANALPIEGWTSDPNDEALLHSIPVLDSLRFVTDVRHILGIRGFM